MVGKKQTLPYRKMMMNKYRMMELEKHQWLLKLVGKHHDEVTKVNAISSRQTNLMRLLIAYTEKDTTSLLWCSCE